MTTTEALNLKYGTVVFYLGTIRAIVQRVTQNGVWISYDGIGPRRGQYLTKRVSARHIEVQSKATTS